MSRGAGSFVPGLVGALALHGLLLGGLFGSEPPKPGTAPRRPPVKVRVATRPAPPPPAVKPPPPPAPVAVEPPPPPPQTPPPKPKPRPAAPQAAELAPPPAPEPPSPAPVPEPPPAPATEPPPKPRRFAVSMEATVPGGGVAVPATSGGSWAYGSQDGDPDGARALAGPKREGETAGGRGRTDARPAEATEATRLPRLLGQPSARDLRQAYPEAARREGREGDVGLKLRVSTAGEVVEVKILRSAGHGFDEAAVALVKTFRFEPARRGDKAVEVWIPWTYKFRLDS